MSIELATGQNRHMPESFDLISNDIGVGLCSTFSQLPKISGDVIDDLRSP